MITRRSINILSFVIGAAVVIIMIVCYYSICSLRENLLKIRFLRQCYPVLNYELTLIGVKTPIDFAFLTENFQSVALTPVFATEKKQAINDWVTWKRSLELFQSMFHRYPLEVASRDWKIILYAEIAAENKIDVSSITAETIVESVSEKVLSYCFD